MARHIALLAYPRCQLLDVGGPWQVFATANELAGTALYRLTLLANAPGPLNTNSGMVLHADRSWRSLPDEEEVDTLLVAGGSGVEKQTSNNELLDTLRAMVPRVRRLGSVCTGAFLLAAAGLLDGHRATTHWRHCCTLADAYPAIDVASDALYVESLVHASETPRYTSAGVTAGIDLALSLLEADYGVGLAGRVARELVVFLHRPGGQSQFSEALRSQQQNVGPLRSLLDVMHSAPGADHRLDTLAAHINVSPRHLSRLFRQYLDTTPGVYLTRLRLEQARQALISGSSPPSLERLAGQWRLGGAEQLRRLFQRYYGVSPSVYWQRFRASPMTASADSDQFDETMSSIGVA